jgi:NAD(P)-dependent dehydrogenase (short-subunit alcohol dehydrogenase family)
MRLEGKVALVTGASQGIGAAYARALATEGAAVLVSDVADAGPVAEAIVASGGRAAAVRADVCDDGQVQAMVDAAVRDFGGVDILVNNAGLFATLKLQPAGEISSAEWDRVMAVNVRGTFACCRAAIPAMQARGYGKIVNIASGTVFKGTPGMLHYVASKGAVVALTRALAREAGADGIRVNCLAPGLTMSEGVRGNPSWAQDIVAGNVASRALKREAVPEDLTGALLFLCSPESDFMTGQTVVVDGGSVMH